MKKFIAIAALIVSAALAFGPASAGSGNDAAIRAIQTLRVVTFLDIIDVAGETDKDIDSKRAMPVTTPLTRLQETIAGNPALVDAIVSQHWVHFDLKSVYSARVEGNAVYLYMGWPPLN